MFFFFFHRCRGRVLCFTRRQGTVYWRVSSLERDAISMGEKLHPQLDKSPKVMLVSSDVPANTMHIYNKVWVIWNTLIWPCFAVDFGRGEKLGHWLHHEINSLASVNNSTINTYLENRSHELVSVATFICYCRLSVVPEVTIWWNPFPVTLFISLSLSLSLPPLSLSSSC